MNLYKINLNLAAFSESCAPLTQAFKTISEKIKQIELKLLTPTTEEAVIETTQHSLGRGLGLKNNAAQIRQI